MFITADKCVCVLQIDQPKPLKRSLLNPPWPVGNCYYSLEGLILPIWICLFFLFNTLISLLLPCRTQGELQCKQNNNHKNT